eukprot:6413555-Amphidinium_carterae.1
MQGTRSAHPQALGACSSRTPCNITVQGCNTASSKLAMHAATVLCRVSKLLLQGQPALEGTESIQMETTLLHAVKLKHKAAKPAHCAGGERHEAFASDYLADNVHSSSRMCMKANGEFQRISESQISECKSLCFLFLNPCKGEATQLLKKASCTRNSPASPVGALVFHVSPALGPNRCVSTQR